MQAANCCKEGFALTHCLKVPSPTACNGLQVVDAANAAQEHVQHLEAEASQVQQENQQLRSAVQQLEVELTELKADAETRDSALESLQGTLTKIERSVDHGHTRTTSPLTGAAFDLCMACLTVHVDGLFWD